MLDELRRLRAQCVATIARIDAILPECEGFEVPVSASRPLAVAGRCETVTQHAIDRYRERTGSKKSDEKVCDQLHCRRANAQEMELKPQFRLIELLAHGTPSRFFREKDLVLVVENAALVTVHHGQADRWIPLETR